MSGWIMLRRIMVLGQAKVARDELDVALVGEATLPHLAPLRGIEVVAKALALMIRNGHELRLGTTTLILVALATLGFLRTLTRTFIRHVRWWDNSRSLPASRPRESIRLGHLR